MWLIGGVEARAISGSEPERRSLCRSSTSPIRRWGGTGATLARRRGPRPMTDRLEPGTGSQTGTGPGPRGAEPDPAVETRPPGETAAVQGASRSEEDRLDREENARRSRIRRVGTDAGLIVLYALLTMA